MKDAKGIVGQLGKVVELLDEEERQRRRVQYGFFPGGDPRLFRPDEELCTELEKEAWRRAVEEAGQGQAVPSANRHGEPRVGHSFGLGTYEVEADPDEPFMRARAMLVELLASMEKGRRG